MAKISVYSAKQSAMANVWEMTFSLLAQQNGAGAAPANPGGGFGDWGLLPVMVIIGVLFYVMLVLPERRKRKELQNTLDGLRENDQVVTIGGIIGTIVQISTAKDEVVLRVDEKTNTKIRLLRSSISRPYKGSEEAAKEGAKLVEK